MLYNITKEDIVFLAILNSKRYELEFSSFYLNEEQKIHILSKERQDDTAVNGKTKKKTFFPLSPPPPGPNHTGCNYISTGSEGAEKNVMFFT